MDRLAGRQKLQAAVRRLLALRAIKGPSEAQQGERDKIIEQIAQICFADNHRYSIVILSLDGDRGIWAWL